MKKLLYIGALSALLLSACGDNSEIKEEGTNSDSEVEVGESAEEKAAREAKEAEEKALAEQKAKEDEEKTVVSENPSWQVEIETLAANTDGATDKFYALEKFMMEYKSKATPEEVESFKKNILKAYQDKIYLNNPTDHQIMLTQIFQSYIVEQNEVNDWKDFAFDFHQNVKYVYRGADAPDSEAVKANEAQMDKVIDNLQ